MQPTTGTRSSRRWYDKAVDLVMYSSSPRKPDRRVVIAAPSPHHHGRDRSGVGCDGTPRYQPSRPRTQLELFPGGLCTIRAHARRRGTRSSRPACPRMGIEPVACGSAGPADAGASKNGPITPAPDTARVRIIACASQSAASIPAVGLVRLSRRDVHGNAGTVVRSEATQGGPQLGH